MKRAATEKVGHMHIYRQTCKYRPFTLIDNCINSVFTKGRKDPQSTLTMHTKSRYALVKMAGFCNVESETKINHVIYFLPLLKLYSNQQNVSVKQTETFCKNL